MNKRNLGQKAEEIALNYLKTLGYKYITKNFFTIHGEIDLIFKDSDFFVFVEVKSIREYADFNIYETITKKKKERIKKCINDWLLKYNHLNQNWRVDFVGITYHNQDFKLDHFKFLQI